MGHSFASHTSHSVALPLATLKPVDCSWEAISGAIMAAGAAVSILSTLYPCPFAGPADSASRAMDSKAHKQPLRIIGSLIVVTEHRTDGRQYKWAATSSKPPGLGRIPVHSYNC